MLSIHRLERIRAANPPPARASRKLFVREWFLSKIALHARANGGLW